MQKFASLPRHSASLLLIKENMKILFIQRPATGSFANMYAFPGGNCDPNDQLGSYADKYKITALRETFEEVGIVVGDNLQGPMEGFPLNHLPDPKLLNPFMRLITVQSLPNRYDTRYYIAFKFGNGKADYEDLENLSINHDECVKYQWLTPLEAIALYYKSEIKLAPPQFLILNILSSFKDIKSLQIHLDTSEMHFAPYLLSFSKNQGVYPNSIKILFDHEYPIKDIIALEQLGSPLREELSLYQDTQPLWRNRIQIGDPATMFTSNFDVDVQVPFQAPLLRLSNFTEIIRRLKEAQLMNDNPKL